jgi:hypothetical protein
MDSMSNIDQLLLPHSIFTIKITQNEVFISEHVRLTLIFEKANILVIALMFLDIKFIEKFISIH